MKEEVVGQTILGWNSSFWSGVKFITKKTFHYVISGDSSIAWLHKAFLSNASNDLGVFQATRTATKWISAELMRMFEQLHKRQEHSQKSSPQRREKCLSHMLQMNFCQAHSSCERQVFGQIPTWKFTKVGSDFVLNYLDISVLICMSNWQLVSDLFCNMELAITNWSLTLQTSILNTCGSSKTLSSTQSPFLKVKIWM